MNIPEKVDVLVIGAGPGGWPAAVGAARRGAKVLLVEEDPYPGGAPVDWYVTMPCGGYITGLYAELIDKLEENHRLPVPEHGPIPRLWSRWFLPSSFRLEIQRLINAEPNLTFLPGLRVTEPLTEQTGTDVRVKGALLPLSGKNQPVEAHTVLDATGHGAFAEAAGAKIMYGTEGRGRFDEPHAPPSPSKKVQQCTLMYIAQRMGNTKLDFKAKGIKRGVDPEFGWLDRDYEIGLKRSCGIYLTWGGTVECADTRDHLELGRACQEALNKIEKELEVLQNHDHMVYIAPKLGVREVRRIEGETILTENWLREGRMPEDTVAVGNWHIDNWGGDIPLEQREVPPYGIPLRALMPKDTRNLLMACRAISISHLAYSSWRVQPTVAAAGQAAGVTAALAAENKTETRDVPFTKIKTELETQRQGFDI